MKLKPHKYQEKAIRKIITKESLLLLADPGLGKTIMILLAYIKLRAKGLVNNMLIVAPLNPMRLVWPQEAEKWGLPIVTETLHGTGREAAVLSDRRTDGRTRHPQISL